MPENITRKTIIERLREKYRSGDKNKRVKIESHLQKIEKELENTESAISFTVPESRFMPNSDKVTTFSYNPQIAVDSSSGIVISNDVTSEATDRENLQPQIKQAEENVASYLKELK